MDFSNLVKYVADHHGSNDQETDELELEVTNNIKHLGHNQNIKPSPFSEFIVYDSDISDGEDDDTEEEFPMFSKNNVMLNINNNIKVNTCAEYDEAPKGHNPMLLPTFTNICFVTEDEPPVRSLIKRV